MNLCKIIFVFSLFCFGAAYSMQRKDNSYNEVMAVINSYLKPLKKEGIDLRGYGLHYAGPDKIYDGKIHEIDLALSIDKPMQFEEARKLFYTVADGLLSALNKKEEIRGCLYNYPLTYKDFYLRLSFDYEQKGYLKRDDIDMIAILNNQIMYSIVEEDGQYAGVETKKVIPDVYMGTGAPLKTRWITKKLPESDY